MTDLVVGCPAWDRAWSLPLWFQSVKANVNPAETGLVFVVPAADSITREAIALQSGGFKWVEVIREKGTPKDRSDRPGDQFATLARARNAVLSVVTQSRPSAFISWDTDFLVPPGTVEAVRRQKLPAATVWAWLNRQTPRTTRWRPTDTDKPMTVQYQDPVRATAMKWDPKVPARALHYPAVEWNRRSIGIWKTAVIQGWVCMDERAYMHAHHAPHPDSGWIPFNWQLERRGVDRYCVGDITGVHLYDRGQTDEIKAGWPNVLKLANQRPLAATYEVERSPEWQAFGMFPIEEAA